MTDIASRIKSAKSHLQNLTTEIESLKSSKLDGSLVKSASKRSLPSLRSLACVRTFKAHVGDVTSLHWSGNDQMFASTGKDGQLVLWNAMTKRRLQTISPKTQWLMTCAYERGNNRLVATGGADKICFVYVTGQAGVVRPSAELKGHDGYLSQCRFVDERDIITTSGDSTARLWDVSTSQSKAAYTEHAADCMAVAINNTNRNMFATGSADCTAKIWDIRSGKCTHTFNGHESDINSIDFFPDGFAIGTASTDSTCRMFDLRSCFELRCFENEGSQFPATSGMLLLYHILA
jgi:guanine nucleotide-binding protein G(I)/G(S)/G(T) subunit beta-1